MAVPEPIASAWPGEPSPQSGPSSSTVMWPDLAGGAVLADQRPAVDHDAAADPGRDGDVDRRRRRLARRAVAPLGHDRDVRVALEEGGQTQGRLDALDQRDVPPAGQVGRREHDAAPRVERAWRGDADADGIRPVRRLRGIAQDRGGKRADPIDTASTPSSIVGVRGPAAGDDEGRGSRARRGSGCRRGRSPGSAGRLPHPQGVIVRGRGRQRPPGGGHRRLSRRRAAGRPERAVKCDAAERSCRSGTQPPI